MIFAFVYGIRHCVSPLSLVRSGLALIALWGLRSGLALFALWPYKDSLPHWRSKSLESYISCRNASRTPEPLFPRSLVFRKSPFPILIL